MTLLDCVKTVKTFISDNAIFPCRCPPSPKWASSKAMKKPQQTVYGQARLHQGYKLHKRWWARTNTNTIKNTNIDTWKYNYKIHKIGPSKQCEFCNYLLDKSLISKSYQSGSIGQCGSAGPSSNSLLRSFSLVLEQMKTQLQLSWVQQSRVVKVVRVVRVVHLVRLFQVVQEVQFRWSSWSRWSRWPGWSRWS